MKRRSACNCWLCLGRPSRDGWSKRERGALLEPIGVPGRESLEAFDDDDDYDNGAEADLFWDWIDVFGHPHVTYSFIEVMR